MKAKSRKRLLISSVAMLLVAMLALGTATFAWFTSSTTATAKKLSVKTVKASELQVSSAAVDWTDTLEYNKQNVVLKPASSVDGTNWFAADAVDKSGYATTAANVTDISSSLNGYVLVDQLNVRNNGQAAVNDVTISFSISETEAGASGKYFRMALVPVDAKGGTPTAANFSGNVYAAAADSAAAIATLTPAAGETPASFTTSTISASSGASVNKNIGSLTASGTEGSVKYFNLYLWFEGQDEDCKDATAGNYTPDIQFTVTGDTVQS